MTNEILKKLDQLKGRKLLVVGDVGLDEYVMGVVKRISPEAPVPVVEVDGEDQRLGLAANVTQNITALGGEAVLVSVVGADERARVLKNLLVERNVNVEGVVVDASRPTTRKIRVMAGQHHIVRVDYEQKVQLKGPVADQLIREVEKRLPLVDGVILQDYSKGVLSESTLQHIIQSAKKLGKRVMVDPYRTTPVRFYRGADLMTPNFEEALMLSGRNSDDPIPLSESLVEVGGDLMKGIESNTMVITRGKDGVSLFEKDKALKIPTFARQVFDVTGAGDTFIAALSLAWVSGLSLEESCWLANHAAGVVVGKVGCVPCSIEELKASISN